VAQQLYTEKLNEIFDVDAPVDLSANAVFTEKPEKPSAE